MFTLNDATSLCSAPKMAAYLRPDSVDAALDALHRAPLTILAGGTDFFPARVGKPLHDDVLDISAVRELRGIAQEQDHWRIGANATWSDLLNAKLPRVFDGLKAAALEVGGVQIQNAGTICGNVCNASPAADGIPPLLALDAQVEVRSHLARKQIPLDQFVINNRKTALLPGELVTAILIPHHANASRSGFLKLGARKYLVISIVMVAATLEVSDAGIITHARIAVGACSPVARRLPDLEHSLVGVALDRQLASRVTASHVSVLSPIDDIRASRDYRFDAALILLRRLLAQLALDS